ncbi:hypothetical protein [Acinetobacter pittii]|uniref:hypothetical protein n=1 Tax=Acinetobacter pittii TaxID=48296 RepID=UPI001F1ED648|nr:hypothetical protein [Acinetobacter pittii]MCF1281327.1 hypothetical protein [Acinetobacter pittii]
MTVQVADRLSQLYVGNGVNTRFDFIFRVFDQEDETGVAVRVKVGNDFVFLDQSKYAVTVNQDNLGGYVTFNEAPSNQTFFYIAGKTPVDQQLDITNYDNFYPDAIERALDKLTAILQEWKHLVDFETQARILADIDYDQLALQREAELKAYIDGVASSIIGQPVVGLPAQFVQDGPENQKEINSITPRYFSSVDEMLAYPHKRNGLIAITKSYHAGLSKGGSKYVYDSSKASINNGVTIIGGWVLLFDDRICVTQAGCKLDGITDDSIAFNACAALNIPMRIGVSGTLKALSPLNLNAGGLIGSGIFSVIDVVGGHDGIVLPLGGGRLFQNIEKFRMISSDNSATDHIAIRSKQITNPASESLGNGFKIRDIEIGGGGRFGVGIALTDCFRASIENIGMTSCGNAIVLYGRVVQCKVGVVTSNSDEFGDGTYATTALTKLGNISTKIDATKRYGLLVVGSDHTGTYQYPESIKSRDNSYVKHHYGLYHYDGLFCSYKDIDLDYNYLHGAYFYSCNGLVTLDTAWVAQNAGASHGIVIDTSVATPKKLVLKNIHGFSYGALQADSSVIYQSSDGVSKPFRRGVVIEGVTLASNFWTYGININRMRDFTIKNYVEEGTPITRGLNIYNSRDFQITDCICALATIYAPTNEFDVARITGTVTYTLADSATGERINSTSFGVQNKPLQMIGIGGAWKAPVKFGGGYLWITDSGKLLKKTGNVAPTSDTDGVEIT